MRVGEGLVVVRERQRHEVEQARTEGEQTSADIVADDFPHIG